MASLLTEIHGVRSVLGNPLANAPTPEDIAEALEETFQLVTNITNNTGNGWQIGTLNISATAGTYVYQIETPFDDFYKALSVVTVPTNINDPEYVLEFTEIEHIPQEWAYLNETGRLYYSTHSANFIAFYRKLGVDGETIWCEIRPVPAQDETYKITYQIGSWWDRIENTSFTLPHREFRFHLRRLAAQTLLHKCRWSYDEQKNALKKVEVGSILDRAIAMGAKTFDDHIASLDNADIVEMETFGDRYGL